MQDVPSDRSMVWDSGCGERRGWRPRSVLRARLPRDGWHTEQFEAGDWCGQICVLERSLLLQGVEWSEGRWGEPRRPFRKVLQETMMPCLKAVAVNKGNTLYTSEVSQVEI